MKEKVYKIRGMHCASCELAIENATKKSPGVKRAKANTKKGTLLIKGASWDEKAIEAAVTKAGYGFGDDEKPFISLDPRKRKNLIAAILTILGLIVVAEITGFSKYFDFQPSSASSLAVIFAMGLLAGISTCMAIVGGLLLAISTRHAEKYPQATFGQKFRPQVFFNFGRIISYTVLGGVIGLIGSALRLSPIFDGFLTVFVALVMFILGIQLLGVFPRLNNIFVLPKAISAKLGLGKEKEYSHSWAFALGGLTFFLPCGFTQAAQLLAVASGSWSQGALIMGIFSLGTAPGLVGIGGITAALKKGNLSDYFYKLIAIIVIVFSLYNFSNGFRLLGAKNIVINMIKATEETSKKPANDGSVQVLEATFKNDTIKPNKFEFESDSPAKIVIHAKSDGLGCMGSVMIPGLVNRYQIFRDGKDVILDIPTGKTGTYNITCAMGIKSGTVVIK